MNNIYSEEVFTTEFTISAHLGQHFTKQKIWHQNYYETYWTGTEALRSL